MKSSNLGTHFDPNSQHQTWSLWTFVVKPGVILDRPFREVKYNFTHFARKAFGTATELKLEWDGSHYHFKARTEGHPAHDPNFVKYYRENFTKFFVNGFGIGTTVTLDVKLEAGSRQDGSAPEQLLMLPNISLRES
jgi:hypothetical protein